MAAVRQATVRIPRTRGIIAANQSGGLSGTETETCQVIPWMMPKAVLVFVPAVLNPRTPGLTSRVPMPCYGTGPCSSTTFKNLNGLTRLFAGWSKL